MLQVLVLLVVAWLLPTRFLCLAPGGSEAEMEIQTPQDGDHLTVKICPFLTWENVVVQICPYCKPFARHLKEGMGHHPISGGKSSSDLRTCARNYVIDCYLGGWQPNQRSLEYHGTYWYQMGFMGPKLPLGSWVDSEKSDVIPPKRWSSQALDFGGWNLFCRQIPNKVQMDSINTLL